MAYNYKTNLPVLDINMRAEVSSLGKTINYLITVKNTRSFRQPCKLVTAGYNAREETFFRVTRTHHETRAENKSRTMTTENYRIPRLVFSQLSLLVFQKVVTK